MKLEAHCEQSVRIFGTEYREVHLWLDEYFSALGARHRRRCHHLAGIEEVRQKWGDRASEVAKQHVIDDLKEEGWVDGDHFPRDEADYVRMGLF